MFLVVLRRSGPEWKPDSEAAVRETLAQDPWSGTHLRVDTIDQWTMRLDGRRR
jgi:hypothetical protein